jgi:hypothetical protein
MKTVRVEPPSYPTTLGDVWTGMTGPPSQCDPYICDPDCPKASAAVRLTADEAAALDWCRKHLRANWAVPEAHAAAAVLDRLLATVRP